MTREKKNIINEIRQAYAMIEASMELGAGIFVEKDLMDHIRELDNRLARLQGFKDYNSKIEWQMKNIPSWMIEY